MRETFSRILLVLTIMVKIRGSIGPLPSPSVGDVRMVPYERRPGYYKVQLFYTDGLQKPEWRGFCYDNSYKEEAVTLCRHMGGYEGATFKSDDTGDSVWLKDVNCNGNELHILRCGYSVVSGNGNNDCTYKLLVRCDFKTPLDPYDGQLSLCPVDSLLPTSNNGTRYSVSFGVVSLYMKNTKTWRGLDQNSSNALLGCNEADTICKQMGYTGAEPGSAIAISATNYKFDKCYDDESDAPFMLQKGSWKTTSEINCRNQSHNCFKSCYDYQTRTTCEKCEPSGTHSVVIKCDFDPTKLYQISGSSGSRKECDLENSSDIHGVAIGIPVSVFIVVIICIIIVFYWYKKPKRTHTNL